jgi:hypothetical protein
MKSKAQAAKNTKRGSLVAPVEVTNGKKTIAPKVKAATPLEVAAVELFGNDAEAAAAHGIKLEKGKKSPGKPRSPAEAAIAAPAKKEGKGATILRLIGRDQGATLSEIMTATDWLPHSVGGFIFTASKKRTLECTKSEAGERTYKLVE